jgi:dolichol-phosphate mannosyltransferase
MKLSIVLPARDEEGSVGSTLLSLSVALREARIAHELLVVNDGSSDRTATVVSDLMCSTPEIRLIANTAPHGFGLAVRAGLREVTGDAIAIVMADGSDSPADVVACYRKLTEGYDCVFGSRFRPGSEVIDYPIHKLLLNRLANRFIQALFRLKCNDITNAFKC